MVQLGIIRKGIRFYGYEWGGTNKLFSAIVVSCILMNVLCVILIEAFQTGDSKYRKLLIEEIEEENIQGKDILMQMPENNDETTDCFKISKRQAQSSFWFSIIACIIGIITTCLSFYALFEIKDIQFAIISIVGGTITELIAGTVLVIHNKSALQLNYYYDALHENEKILSAINLADKFGKDKREKMYVEIIKAQIRTSEENKENEK